MFASRVQWRFGTGDPKASPGLRHLLGVVLLHNWPGRGAWQQDRTVKGQMLERLRRIALGVVGSVLEKRLWKVLMRFWSP